VALRRAIDPEETLTQPLSSTGEHLGFASSIRRLQTFRYLHDCSDCFRPEHSPGGFAPTGKRRLITAHTPSGHSIGIAVRR